MMKSLSPLLLLLLVFSCQQQRQHHFANASQAAGTETLVAVVGKDFVLVGADSSVSQSISLTASNLDKIAVVSEPFRYGDERTQQTTTRPSCPRYGSSSGTILAAAAGDAADADRLIGMLQAQAAIQEYQAGVGVDVDYIDTIIDDYDNSLEQQQKQQQQQLQVESYGLTVDSLAHLCRGQIARSLRSKTPMKVCLLIAGLQPVCRLDEGNTATTDTTSFVADQVQRQVQQAYATRRGESLLVQEAKATVAATATAGTTTSTSTTATTLIPRLYWLDEYGSLQNIQYGAHGHGSNFILSILDQGYRPNLTLEEATKLLRDCFQQLRTRYVINSPQPPCIKCVDARGCRLIR